MYPDYRDSFPNNEAVKHIEFGAGKGVFGKVEFSECFLTDITDNDVVHASEIAPVILGTCHFLDGLADFYNFDFEGRRFDKLIFCNPFKFGFNGKTETAVFLRRAEELLNESGELFILGQHSNLWVRRDKAQKWIDNYNAGHSLASWEFFRILTESELDEINTKHIFRKSTGEPIYVNLGYILKLNQDDNNERI